LWFTKENGEPLPVNLETHFDLRRCIPLERDEEMACAADYARTKDPLLAQRLVTANLRLVVAIAKAYRRGEADMRDLIQEGNLGLMHAVTRFDPSRGVKLCSYATWWIRAYILKYTIANWRLVKTGTTQAQRRLFFRLQRERSKFERNGIRPDATQLAAALSVKERDVVNMIERFAGGETSLEAPAGAQESATKTIGDFLSADSGLRPDVRIETLQFDQAIRDKLELFARTLQGRERKIYKARLVSEDPVTLSDLAVGFGVTRERTRQLEQRLKGRIRDYLRHELGDAVEPSRMAA
jgi:RNA polymerase sigma-32 factor